jgi:hypothetical protein
VGVPTGHAAHRRAWWAFVLRDPDIRPAHQAVLRRLFALWERTNAAHFGGALVPPYVLLAEPASPRAYGDCATHSGWGARSQIRLRPSLLDGGHRDVRAGAAYAEGRLRVAEDVLLHETVHQ